MTTRTIAHKLLTDEANVVEWTWSDQIENGLTWKWQQFAFHLGSENLGYIDADGRLSQPAGWTYTVDRRTLGQVRLRVEHPDGALSEQPLGIYVTETTNTLAYFYDFGDGTTAMRRADQVGDATHAPHTYTRVGTYTVQVAVREWKPDVGYSPVLGTATTTVTVTAAMLKLSAGAGSGKYSVGKPAAFR